MQDAIAKKTIAACRQSALACLAGATILLGGCGSIPDVVNPLTWFEDDEPSPPPAAAKPGTSAANKDYPKLGSVPKRPPSLETQQAGIAQGLAADNENARYTDAKIQQEVARRAAGPRAKSAVGAVPAPRPVPPAPRVAPPRPTAMARAPASPQPQIARTNSPRPVTVPSAVPPATVRPTASARPIPVSPPARPPPSPFVAPPVTAPAPGPAPSLAFTPGQTVQVATIYFTDGSTKLQRNDEAILREIAAAQRQTGNAVLIVGHASGRVRTFDPSRRHLINYQVSLDRAHAVAATLLNLGVPVGKIRVDGKGDTAPLYAEYSPTGEAANRRAELYFVN